MLGLALDTRVFLCTVPTDMRMGFDGLVGIVTAHLRKDPVRDGLFVFINRRRDRMKILVWQRHGFWLLYTRLEAGRFQVPPVEPGAHAEALVLGWEQLMMIIEGIDLRSVRRRKRYEMPATGT